MRANDEVAYCLNGGGMGRIDAESETLLATPILEAGARTGKSTDVVQGMAVRRLTPTECERLQGFPDGYTLVPHRGKPLCDGPRYKLLGNSWAVPCVRWVFERLDFVDKTLREDS